MRKAIFSLIAAAALAVGSFAPAWARSSAAGPEKTSMLLAKMVEKDDQIIYGTDSEGQKSSRELAKEEKEKQDRAWQMLERMEIYQLPRNKPGPPKQDQPQQ